MDEPTPSLSPEEVGDLLARYAGAHAEALAEEERLAQIGIEAGLVYWPDVRAAHVRTLLALVGDRAVVLVPEVSYRLRDVGRALHQVVYGTPPDGLMPAPALHRHRKRLFDLVLLAKAAKESEAFWRRSPSSKDPLVRKAYERACALFARLAEMVKEAERDGRIEEVRAEEAAERAGAGDDLVRCPDGGELVSVLLGCGICPYVGPEPRTCRYPYVAVLEAAVGGQVPVRGRIEAGRKALPARRDE